MTGRTGRTRTWPCGGPGPGSTGCTTSSVDCAWTSPRARPPLARTSSSGPATAPPTSASAFPGTPARASSRPSIVDYAYPTRGLVRTPGAALLTAHLRRLGHCVRQTQHPFDAASEPGSGRLFTASYKDRSGCAVGLAVAGHRAHTAGLLAAEEAVKQWSSIWRIRRVLIASAQCPCTGESTLDGGSGAQLCPLVATAEADLRRMARAGDQVSVIGKRDHPATRALLAHAADAVVIETVADVATVRLDPRQPA